MDRIEITKLIETLSRSCGLYGRLLRDINELSDEDANDFWDEMEEEKEE